MQTAHRYKVVRYEHIFNAEQKINTFAFKNRKKNIIKMK